MPVMDTQTPITPAPAPRKRRTGLLIAAAVVAVLVVGGVVAAVTLTGGNSGAAATAGATPSSTYSWAPMTFAPGTAQAGPDQLTKPVGQTIGIETSSDDGVESDVDYTVTKVVGPARSKDPFDNENVKGMFVVVYVTESVTKGSAYACSCDFQLVGPDGTTYDQTSALGWDDIDAGDIQTGQKKSGTVVFDVPKGDVHQYKVHLDLGSDDVDGNWQI